METKFFLLGTTETNKAVKLIKVLFGVVCLVVAVFWLVFNIRSIKADGTLWITIIFLTGFGSYQILSGLGRTTRYIEICLDKIRLKKNPIMPEKEICATEINNIELYPLNIIFFLKTHKRILLRFGTIHYETNTKIIDEIIGFADSNQIPFEIIEEEI
jgi:hypothetical protein